MRLVNLILAATVLSAVSANTAVAQKHIAAGDYLERGGNRLISTLSEPGRQLSVQKSQPKSKLITLDAQMSETHWRYAQVTSSFADPDGRVENTTVRVLFDRDNIYLFWQVDEQPSITASVKENDTVITADDYVQINLKPSLPDTIKHGCDYYYSIAVNPNGAVWDAYYDPYLEGYFFSSWDSRVQIVTRQNDSRWFAEMIIPFAGLDNYSDPGWKWNLDFVHAAKIDETHPAILYAPEAGITVQQGIMVRRSDLVGYYWPRPEFMQEVKPPKCDTRKKNVSVVTIDKTPAVNGRCDHNLWAGIDAIQINHRDKTGKKLSADTATAKIANTGWYLCFSLQAEGAKIKESPLEEVPASDGMARQTANVNGVYIDTSLFASECFWVLLQPRQTGADSIHNPYYLITVSNAGRIEGICYDRFGAPDRTWRPEATADIYNTANGWGAEISISLACLDVPAECSGTWGFNVFRNRLLAGRPKPDMQLQAWAYTAFDFLNPETMGTLAGLKINNLDVTADAVNRKIVNMREKINAYASENKSSARQLLKQLDSIKTNSIGSLCTAENTLEQIDNRLGLLDARKYYQSTRGPAKGGYPLFDVQFIGNKGWAVGAMGTVLRTDNRGKTWQSVEIDTDADLYRVFFVDKKTGWAAGGRIRMAATNAQMRHDRRGGYGYIFHTSDGGRTWRCQYGQRGRHLFGLYFTDKKTGYACGERGILLKTENGGADWKLLPTTGTIKWLYGIAFRDKLNGFAVGQSETVIRTSDAGKTWTTVHAGADRKFYGFRPFYRDVTFNGSTGCIVGQNGCIVISNDAGRTWSPAATFFAPAIRELLDLRHVLFVTEKTGYAVGELGSRIMVTEDAGQSWSLRPAANSDWLRALWADANGRLVLVGEREKILASDDKGFTWKTLRGDNPRTDVLVMLAHGDDSPILLGTFLAHYAINEGKQIVDLGVLRDCHSSEYEETYNLEHDRHVWMSGVRTSTNFDEFETGNNGCDYYHFTKRLWQGENNVVHHMVAAIRAYRPDIVIIHDPVYGDYDKPGHKLSGRAGIPAFETSGGDVDHWPQLTRLGLEPWQAKKLYCVAGESYPPTIDLTPLNDLRLKGTEGTCHDWAEYALRNFQSQGVHHARDSQLCLIKSLVPVPEKEVSVFDGL